MYLLVGLGNPGPRYRKTRHNVGFMALDLLAERSGRKFESFHKSSLVCSTTLAGKPVLLAKPQTFMNLSGLAVSRLVGDYEIDLSEILIVYDEIALPLGVLRFRRSGSAGGHKGMQSVIDGLESREIPRLRIGIGRKESPEDLSDFVLTRFSGVEKRVLEESLDRAAEGLESFVRCGIDRTMSFFNSKP